MSASDEPYSPTNELLSEVENIVEHDNLNEAFDRINAHLAENPNDYEVILFRSELSLRKNTRLGYVRACLMSEEIASQFPDRHADQRQRAENQVADMLSILNRCLRSGDILEARELTSSISQLTVLDPTPMLSVLAILIDSNQRERLHSMSDPLQFMLQDERPGRWEKNSRRAELTEQVLAQTAEHPHLNQQHIERLHQQTLNFALARGEFLSALEYVSNLDAERQTQVVQYVVRSAARAIILMMRDDIVPADAVDKCVKAGLRGAVDSPLFYLLQGLSAYRRQDFERARQLFQAMLAKPQKRPHKHRIDHVQALWRRVQSVTSICHNCGSTLAAPDFNCKSCDAAPWTLLPIVDDKGFATGGVAAAAHICLAHTLAAIGDYAAALKHLELAALPISADTNGMGLEHDLEVSWLQAVGTTSEIRALVDNLRQKFLTAQAQQDSSRVRKAEQWLAAGRLDDQALATLAGWTSEGTAQWESISLRSRVRIGQMLLRQGALKLAGAFLRSALALHDSRSSVQRLKTELQRKSAKAADQIIAEAETAYDAGHFTAAQGLIAEALALSPHHLKALLCRAEIHLQSEEDLLALADFRQILLLTSPSDAIHQMTRLKIALILEREGELNEALALLEGVNHPTVTDIRARVERRLRGEPAILVHPSDSVVMHDTLIRQSCATQYHGYVAVMVRAVSRPHGRSLDAWTNRVLQASIHFVRALAGLQDAIDEPMISLRLISRPNLSIPEQGRLDIAFVVRVTGDTSEACAAAGQDIWQTLRILLPGSLQYAYDYEPVVDQDELKYLLEPFPVASIAEIVRREQILYSEEDHYAVYPFSSDSINLHELCWTLLHQHAPAMLSLQLMPTALMPWEHAAVDDMMRQPKRQGTGQRYIQEDIISGDPVAEWWTNDGRLRQALANRQSLDSLGIQAYILRVLVAGSADSSRLVAEQVATALLSPVHTGSHGRQGGCEIIRPTTQTEYDAACRNLRSLDIEQWVYTRAPNPELNRMRYLIGEAEAAAIFRLPIPTADGVPGVTMLEARPAPPPANMAKEGTRLGLALINRGGTATEIKQALPDRLRHAYIVGKTGTGKTTLIMQMALQDIEAGSGIALIDPHGDMIKEILARIPEHRMRDVVLFDPSDETWPVGLNLLEWKTETEKHRIASEFIAMLMHKYDPHQHGIVGPRFQHNVRNAMLTVMVDPTSTLIEVVRALSDMDFVRTLLPRITDPMVRNYWEKQIKNTSDFHKSEILDYVVSKFNEFTGDRRIRNIIGQRQTTMDFRQIMDQKQILLVNLSKGQIGSDSAQFLGLLVVQRLLISALSRANVPVEQRPDFYIYVDEFQNFATDLFATMLSEGRKYGVAVIAANQYLTQLPRTVYDAVFGNVGSIISFRLGHQDADILETEMFPVFGKEDLLNLPRYTACVKLQVNGMAAYPFTMRTLPDLRALHPERADTIREHSRKLYGRPLHVVEAEVNSRFII